MLEVVVLEYSSVKYKYGKKNPRIIAMNIRAVELKLTALKNIYMMNQSERFLVFYHDFLQPAS